jgi:hypothetical protein
MCKASEPRDKVYAFFGLADPKYNIIPDYNSTLEEVFTHTCQRIILHEQTLDILSHGGEKNRHQEKLCLNVERSWLESWKLYLLDQLLNLIGVSTGMERALTETTSNKLPSWVPDWRLERRNSLLCPFEGNALMYPFNASSGSGADVTFSCSGVLRTKCLIIDDLAGKNSLGIVKDGESMDKISRLRVYLEWQKIAQVDLQNNYFTAESISEAFLLTLRHGISDSDFLLNGEDVINSHQRRYKENFDRHWKLALEESLSGPYSFFRSPKGYIGLAHFRAQHTDKICIFPGASIPFIIRKEADNYLLIGEAYVHGFMYGEAMQMMERGELKFTTIELH